MLCCQIGRSGRKNSNLTWKSTLAVKTQELVLDTNMRNTCKSSLSWCLQVCMSNDTLCLHVSCAAQHSLVPQSGPFLCSAVQHGLVKLALLGCSTILTPWPRGTMLKPRLRFYSISQHLLFFFLSGVYVLICIRQSVLKTHYTQNLIKTEL